MTFHTRDNLLVSPVRILVAHRRGAALACGPHASQEDVHRLLDLPRVPALRGWVDQDDPRNQLRVLGREARGGSAAERVADHGRPLEVELANDARDVGGVIRRGVAVLGLVGLAVAAQIHGVDVEGAA